MGFDPYASPGPIASLCSFLKGGKLTFMEYAHYVHKIEPGLQRVIDEWDRWHPSMQKHIDLDQLCKSKGVDPIHFILVAAEAALRFRDRAIILIAAVNTPVVLNGAVREVLKRQGTKERREFRQHYGALPIPNGAPDQIAARAEINREKNNADEAKFPTIERTILENDKLIRENQEQTAREAGRSGEKQ
jgi:hypothetical protein